jgi:pimeloyl-ACP methyl ester carboxylesterase
MPIDENPRSLMNTGLHSVNGIQMFCEIRGAGVPRLLLHGFTGSSQDWKLIYPLPLDSVCLIAPDLRGHGRSNNSAGEFTHRQSALDVFALLDDLGVERFEAIGISAGGNTLLHMATQQPERLRAMILVSATTHFPDEARALMGRTTIESRTDEEWAFMRRSHKYWDVQIRALWRQVAAFKDSYDDMNFTPETLAAIKARTLIVHGEKDPLYPNAIAEELARGIPGSRLWIVPGGGHVPIFGETSAKFREIAAGFFAGADFLRAEGAGSP